VLDRQISQIPRSWRHRWRNS